MLPVVRWFLEEPGGVSSLGPLALHTCCQIWGGAEVVTARQRVAARLLLDLWCPGVP